MINYELKLKEEYTSLTDFMEDLKEQNEKFSVTTTHKDEIKSFADLSAKLKIIGNKKKIKCQNFRIVTISQKLENGNYKLIVILIKFDSEGTFKEGSFETLLIKEKRKTELELFEELFQF